MANEYVIIFNIFTLHIWSWSSMVGGNVGSNVAPILTLDFFSRVALIMTLNLNFFDAYKIGIRADVT